MYYQTNPLVVTIDVVLPMWLSIPVTCRKVGHTFIGHSRKEMGNHSLRQLMTLFSISSP